MTQMLSQLKAKLCLLDGQDSAVGTATRYRLGDQEFELQ
jgi:hypothetical protein